MRITSVLKHKHFGELAYIRGLITYKISPFEQYTLSGMSTAVTRTFNRIRGSIFKVAPPFILYYIGRTELPKINKKMNRKNPADYANDK